MVQSENKIRVILKAFDHRILDQSAGQIVETAERTGARVAGPVPLPTAIKRFCVLRAPHIDKESREIFELWKHHILIDIHSANHTCRVETRIKIQQGGCIDKL